VSQPERKLRLCRFYVDAAGEQLKQSGQAQAVFDRALQSPPDSAAYQIVTNAESRYQTNTTKNRE